MVNWNPYLESLRATYAQWSECYTITDAPERHKIKSKLLALSLRVQNVSPAKEEKSEGQEKIEQLGVLEGLRKYAGEHVLLVGKPGSGKSTALKRLLLEEAENALSNEQVKIPVLVELRYYQTSVLDAIGSFLRRHGLWMETAEIEKQLFEGRWLLLVDGLNELPDEAARRDVKVFRQSNLRTPMIFTTRVLGMGGDLDIDKQLQMLPLNKSQIRDFVNNYLPERGEQMLGQLGGRLQQFGQTPLLLWMLCSVFDEIGEVPPNLGLVFRQFTEKFQQELKEDVPENSRHLWQLLLKHLAFRMTQGREATELQVAIPRQQAEEILSELLRNQNDDKPDARAISGLQDLLKHHLIQLGAEDRIEFRHQLIQEYYTAEYLLEQLKTLSDNQLKKEYLNYLKWTKPLALMLELVDEREQAVRVIKLALDVDLMLGARLAGAVKTEFQEQTVSLIDRQNIPDRVKSYLVCLTRSDKAIPALLKALEDEDNDVRIRAADALVKIGTEAAITALFKALEDEHYYVRSSAAYALHKIGTEAAIPALLKALEDEHHCVRGSAAYALGEIGTEAAIPALLKALEDEYNYIRTCAANILGKIGTEATISALMEVLENERDDVRSSAAKALGEIGTEAAIPALFKALEDEHYYVRSSAADALGKIGTEAAIPALFKALEDEHYYVRSRSANALGKIGTEAAIPALLKSLEDENYHVCCRAANALGKIGTETAITALFKALKHERYHVRGSAAGALGKIGTEAVITALLKALEDEDYYVRSSAADALGEISTDAAIPALLKALGDKDNYVRNSAADALGKIGTEAAIIALFKALEDEDNYVRSSALDALRKIADALGKIGTEAAIPALLKALEDEDNDVRSSAAGALGKIGTEAVIPALLKALEDEDYYVRGSAADALGEIGNPSLLDTLTQYLKQTGRLDIIYIIYTHQERWKFYNYSLT